jgi:hypothetical protein
MGKKRRYRRFPHKFGKKYGNKYGLNKKKDEAQEVIHRFLDTEAPILAESVSAVEGLTNEPSKTKIKIEPPKTKIKIEAPTHEPVSESIEAVTTAKKKRAPRKKTIATRKTTRKTTTRAKTTT